MKEELGRCEALLIIQKGDTKVGDRCPDRALKKIGGRYLCWAHGHATKNPVRGFPLRFVDPGAPPDPDATA